MSSSQCESLITVGVILGASASTWLSVVCKEKSQLSLMRNSPCAQYVHI